MRRSLIVVALGLAACGSKSNPAPTMVGNTATPAKDNTSGAIPAGSYLCRFESGGFKYDPYPCNVAGGGSTAQIEKVGGFERFTGSIEASGKDLLVDANADCGDGTDKCHVHFTGKLAFVDNGLWSGTVTADGATPSGPWWLDGGTLDLEYLPPGTAPTGGQLYAGYGQPDPGEEGD